MFVEKDLAYFLHIKPYRENSSLVYLLTKKSGKVCFIVNGLRSISKGKTSGSSKMSLLQPFRLINLSYKLKTGLSKIVDIELNSNKKTPNVSYFMFYQYIHELLLKLLPEKVADKKLFIAYTIFLQCLSNNYPNFALRYMEIALIDYFDGILGIYQHEQLLTNIDKNSDYSLDKLIGISHLLHSASAKHINGQQLSAFNHIVIIYKQYFSDNKNDHVDLPDIIETIAKEAQPISSFFITRLLGNKKLNSKNIYYKLKSMELL